MTHPSARRGLDFGAEKGENPQDITVEPAPRMFPGAKVIERGFRREIWE
jgi:hypothetical protein